MMEDIDENVDDARRVQFPRNGQSQLLPLSPLLSGAIGFRV